MNSYTVVFDGEERMENMEIFAPNLETAYEQADAMGLVIDMIFLTEEDTWTNSY